MVTSRLIQLVSSIPDATPEEKSAIFAAVLHISDELPLDDGKDSPYMGRFRKKFGAEICIKIAELVEEICSPSK